MSQKQSDKNVWKTIGFISASSVMLLLLLVASVKIFGISCIAFNSFTALLSFVIYKTWIEDLGNK
jgi:hypothetical protein